MSRQIILATPRGFCAGVDRAITVVEKALAICGKPVYVRHEVVHNKFVVDTLRQKGAVFIEELDEVPQGATLIYSAHGVSAAIRAQAQERGFTIFDATCPLVTKVHHEVVRLHRQGYTIIMIGHAGHPEVEGTMGQIENRMYLIEKPQDIQFLSIDTKDDIPLAYVSQTTLSVDETKEIIQALRQRFPNIQGPKKDDICYATQSRQDAVKKLADTCDLIIVVGSPNSSNSNRLKEVAALRNIEAYMVDNASQLDPAWLKDKNCIGITAGASAPEILVQEVTEKIREITEIGQVNIQSGQEETISFTLPKELR